MYKYKFQAQYYFQSFAPMDMDLLRRNDDEPSYGSLYQKITRLEEENKILREKLRKAEDKNKRKKKSG